MGETTQTDAYWFDEIAENDDVHDALVKVEESITERNVRSIAGATAFDALAENDEFIGTYCSTWEEILDDLEVEDDEVRHRVRTIHQSAAVHELNMDRQQPIWMLITEK